MPRTEHPLPSRTVGEGAPEGGAIEPSDLTEGKADPSSKRRRRVKIVAFVSLAVSFVFLGFAVFQWLYPSYPLPTVEPLKTIFTYALEPALFAGGFGLGILLAIGIIGRNGGGGQNE